MLENCGVWNYTPPKTYPRKFFSSDFVHFSSSLFGHTKYTSNMAVRFYAKYNDVAALCVYHASKNDSWFKD